jgi:hypothetical protein
MIRSMLATAALVSLTLGAVAAPAAPCKDPRTGKFVKCPPPAAASGARCKDAKGKFARCGTPGARPAGKK